MLRNSYIQVLETLQNTYGVGELILLWGVLSGEESHCRTLNIWNIAESRDKSTLNKKVAEKLIETHALASGTDMFVTTLDLVTHEGSAIDELGWTLVVKGCWTLWWCWIFHNTNSNRGSYE